MSFAVEEQVEFGKEAGRIYAASCDDEVRVRFKDYLAQNRQDIRRIMDSNSPAEMLYTVAKKREVDDDGDEIRIEPHEIREFLEEIYKSIVEGTPEDYDQSEIESFLSSLSVLREDDLPPAFAVGFVTGVAE
jgi:hypothetical protein